MRPRSRMKFGIFYEHQLPRPWTHGEEHKLFQDALEQVEVADKLGIDFAWEVEHHFLEEYSHSSAPEVFLAACSQRTQNIRLGHGIRQVIPQYKPPCSYGRSHCDVGFGLKRTCGIWYRRVIGRARTWWISYTSQPQSARSIWRQRSK